MKAANCVGLLFSLCLGLQSVHAVPDGTIFYAGPDVDVATVGYVHSDGSGHQVIYETPGSGRIDGIDLDPANEHVYWVEGTNSGWRIRRSNFNGSGVIDLITDVSHPDLQDTTGLALDLPNGHMYWVQRTTNGDFSEGKIKRADLSGANITTILSGLDAPWGIEVDSVATGKLYFGSETATGAGTSSLQRADLNGSNLQLVYQAPTDHALMGMAIDPGIPELYFTTSYSGSTISGSTGDVYRATPDGTTVTQLTLPTQQGSLFGIDPLPVVDELYWGSKFPREILYSATDGSGFQALLSAPSFVYDVAAIPYVQIIIPEPTTCTLALAALCLASRRRR